LSENEEGVNKEEDEIDEEDDFLNGLETNLGIGVYGFISIKLPLSFNFFLF